LKFRYFETVTENTITQSNDRKKDHENLQFIQFYQQHLTPEEFARNISIYFIPRIASTKQCQATDQMTE